MIDSSRSYIHTNPVLEISAREQILKDIESRNSAEQKKCDGTNRNTFVARYFNFNAKQDNGAQEDIGQNKRLHIGFAGYFNLEMIAHTRPDAAWLCDINPNQKLFWDTFIELLKRYDSPDTFMNALNARRHGKNFLTLSVNTEGGSQDGVKVELRNDVVPIYSCKTWLKDPDSFNYIRAMALSGKLQARELDVLDAEACKVLRKDVDAQGYQVDTIYTSNIIEFLKPMRSRYTDYQHWQKKESQEIGEVDACDKPMFCDMFASRKEDFHKQNRDLHAPVKMINNVKQMADDGTCIYFTETTVRHLGAMDLSSALTILRGKDELDNAEFLHNGEKLTVGAGATR